MEAVLAEINGWHTDPQTDAQTAIVFGHDREGNLHHGPQIDGYPRTQRLTARPRAAAGFIPAFSGQMEINKANARQPNDYLGHGWGFVWPGDRRIIYNRASAAPNGEPWSERKKLVWWDPDRKMDRH